MKRWIQSAIKPSHKGILREKAKYAGALTEKGTIKESWLKQEAKRSGKIGKEARLALTLKGLHHKSDSSHHSKHTGIDLDFSDME